MSNRGLALRDHPLMTYRRVKNWPPVWTQQTGNGNGVPKTLTGEIGVLTQIISEPMLSKKCFLVIEHDNERYVGTLLFDDSMFCWLVSKMMQTHLGWAIKDIGDLDITFTL